MPAAPDFPPAPDRVAPKRALISLSDMTFQAQVVRSQTGSTLMPFVTILLLYFAMSSAVSFGMRRLERRVTRGLDGVR